VYEFGPFRFEPGESRLLRDGRPVPLAPQGIEALHALVERSGSLVTKQELMDRVWPGRFVEENSLNKCVSELRKALGDRRLEPLYIETVARRGYRFLPEVRRPAMESGPRVRPVTVRVTVELARAHALAGHRDEARRILVPLGRSAASPVFPALVHAALGERASALALLEEARARRSPWMAFLRAEPGFDALREERAFTTLQRRVGLAP
jgi:DNA-binding winged helix-turn-helix (wHTH) protein